MVFVIPVIQQSYPYLLIQIAYGGLIITKSFFLLTNKHVGEITEPWMYGKAKIGTPKVKNSLLFIVIFNKYLAEVKIIYKF